MISFDPPSWFFPFAKNVTFVCGPCEVCVTQEITRKSKQNQSRMVMKCTNSWISTKKLKIISQKLIWLTPHDICGFHGNVKNDRHICKKKLLKVSQPLGVNSLVFYANLPENVTYFMGDTDIRTFFRDYIFKDNLAIFKDSSRKTQCGIKASLLSMLGDSHKNKLFHLLSIDVSSFRLFCLDLQSGYPCQCCQFIRLLNKMAGFCSGQWRYINPQKWKDADIQPSWSNMVSQERIY